MNFRIAPEEIIDSILPLSRYLAHLLESNPDLREELVQNLHRPLRREEMRQSLSIDSSGADSQEGLQRVLRKLRRRVMLRVAARDLAGLTNLQEVMATMTDLAEVAIDFALENQKKALSASDRYGSPIAAQCGTAQELIVVAMGKLGGCELNVSSDVDLIFVYPEGGDTDGRRSVSNQDFFSRLGRRVIGALQEITEDGYVFRVDMRLRPYGESGPLAMSFAMLEDYFVTQGREWERYAWIKSRAITGSDRNVSALTEIARPFVYRKYLDFGAYESMRDLHSQIRQEVQRRELHENIKLGPGGIREIEFISQVFQLIRGGRDPELRLRPTLAALERLREKQQLPERAVADLTDAYCFFRKLEHRLQYLDDQQTHTLPENAADQAIVGTAMGFSSYGDFLKKLEGHRDNVTRHFEKVFAKPRKSSTLLTLPWGAQGIAEDPVENESVKGHLREMGYPVPEKILQRVEQFYSGVRYRHLPKASKAHADALIPALVDVAGRFPPAEVTLARLLDLLNNISRRAAYLSLLAEHPLALERIAKLVSASEWASEYLQRHPIVMDELLNVDAFQSIPDWPRFKTDLILQLDDASRSDGSGTEQQMDVLRHFHHAQIFQLLAKDVEGLLPLETLSDHLTDLADLILDRVLHLAWSGLKRRHRLEPAFAIIGYGKLGGKELGYASDLDIIFIYDDTHPDAPEIYARLSQRINSWLTSYTSAGLLYETDLRLRPNGSSGLLVTSVEAFDEYQKNHAWVWEHQALTRARFVAGDIRIGEAFERTRKEVLSQSRDLQRLKQEILQMRRKILDAHPNSSGLFDVKHDRGGIIDVEFVVQYLVLGHAHDHSELTRNIGNIGLLKLSGELGLVKLETAERALRAYREFRRVQHRLRLSGISDLEGSLHHKAGKFARVEPDYLREEVAAVLALWEEVFGPQADLSTWGTAIPS
jgi:[glutamine synthetase] adenylyltransferase / [glutamine synthetase]-adenylyl-L-tyrosine phosphorylase